MKKPAWFICDYKELDKCCQALRSKMVVDIWYWVFDIGYSNRLETEGISNVQLPFYHRLLPDVSREGALITENQ